MISINEIVLRIDAKHKHSRVNPPRCSCHTIVSTRSTVYRDPKAAQGTLKTDCGGQMGGSPKAPTTASGRGNQPAGGDTESNRSCPGPMTSRGETTLSTSSLAKVQSQPRSSPDGVTVVAAPSGRKNLTCFEVILQADKHAEVPSLFSTTRATQYRHWLTRTHWEPDRKRRETSTRSAQRAMAAS